jgi:uncharacterized protein with PQ loop repeat
MALWILSIIVTGYGLVMAVAPLLQMRHVVRRRSSEGMSIAYFAMVSAGLFSWLIYGLASGSGPLVVVNAVALVVMLATVVTAHRFRPRRADLEIDPHEQETMIIPRAALEAS